MVLNDDFFGVLLHLVKQNGELLVKMFLHIQNYYHHYLILYRYSIK